MAGAGNSKVIYFTSYQVFYPSLDLEKKTLIDYKHMGQTSKIQSFTFTLQSHEKYPHSHLNAQNESKLKSFIPTDGHDVAEKPNNWTDGQERA